MQLLASLAEMCSAFPLQDGFLAWASCPWSSCSSCAHMLACSSGVCTTTRNSKAARASPLPRCDPGGAACGGCGRHSCSYTGGTRESITFGGAHGWLLFIPAVPLQVTVESAPTSTDPGGLEVRINEQYLAKQYKLAVKKANVSASSGGPCAGHFFLGLGLP